MFYIPREKKCNDYELSDLKALGTICPKLKTLDIHFYDPSWSEILSEMVCGCHRVNRFACTTPLSNAALHHVARLPNLEKLRIYTHHLWSLPLPETATAPYFNIRGSLGEYSTTGDNDVFLLPIRSAPGTSDHHSWSRAAVQRLQEPSDFVLGHRRHIRRSSA
ncbi:hypothetical protein PAXINDRAFT_95959 [Paxillus involutus ATCC 200175]|nr:hypothetical protein PAXINDRAFT_95959 [Paxillus involutus ATCC 200175]